MATTSTRSSLARDTSEAAPRRPSKKSSFLSLKREKRQTDTLSVSPQPDVSHAGQSSPGTSNSTLSPSFHAADIEITDQPSIPGPYKPKKQRSSSISKQGAKSKGKDRQYHDSVLDRHDYVPWPTMDFEDVEVRSCTTSGSSHRPWDFGYPRSLNYPYRDSGSSTLSHFDPLPQTPVDDYSFRGRVFASSDMVAAPVSGVEMMDALVDGMNGSSDDDYSPLNSLSNRTHHKSPNHHHPLYHPPLPTPPPGVTLGGGLPRKARKKGESDSEGEKEPSSPRRRKVQEKHGRPSTGRTTSTTSRSSSTPITRTPIFTMPKISMSSSIGSLTSRESPPASLTSSAEEIPREPELAKKSMAPSISDIIRTHAPAIEQARARPLTIYSVADLKEKSKAQQYAASPALQTAEDDADPVSRSSVDTIAEEVRRTLRVQTKSPGSRDTSRVRSTFSRPQSAGTDRTRSPLSDCGAESSIHSRLEEELDAAVPAPLDLSSLTKAPVDSPSQSIAQYLRSSRLTTVLRLTRGPHASRESPLNVSFSDLGSATGSPLVIFLGLGCVRHIMGLYDEMAELLGIRLITIDRWGLGRTDYPRSKLSKGIPEWASVVEEVLDHLNIDHCSVMAHSAGAPYALAFANRFPERIRGDVCLLAPWVGGGEGAGYKWLKYVPNGILKTAQAAEWKVQAWMLGKPPSLAYEGIGFEAQPPPKVNRGIEHIASPTSPRMGSAKSGSSQDTERRSLASSGFSDYDDLRDFDGRFESTVNLHGRQRTTSESKPGWHAITKKTSKGILGRFTRAGNTQPSSPTNPPLSIGPARKLKALRSMGSLKGRSASANSALGSKKSSTAPSAWTPMQSPRTSEVGLGLEDVDWDATIKASSPVAKAKSIKSLGAESSIDLHIEGSRASGRRSISFGANMPKSPRSTVPPVPPLPAVPPSPRLDATPSTGISYQAQLGNALIAASHAESSKGTHGDLLQILNHDRQPWGFSYSAYPHSVRVWYGDRDERIAENAVRWMENTMGHDKCQVQVVKNADHSLMFKSAVVVKVLEYISECWRPD